MKEYSRRIVHDSEDVGKYLTERAKEGWKVKHIQFGAGGELAVSWHIILVRDSEQTPKEAEGR